jgi:hypothetical protein
MKNNPLNSGINNNNFYYYLFPRSLADLNVPYKAINGFSNPSISSFSISNNKIYFETTTVEKVSVFSVNGQLITTVNSTIGRNSIALNNGIYIIKIGEKAVKVVL